MPHSAHAASLSLLLPLLALGLDLLLGDPEWPWHPARLAGRLAIWLEGKARNSFQNETVAGIATAATVVVALAVPAGLLVLVLQTISFWAGFILSLFLIYTTVALRDMCDHSQAVRIALEQPSLILARQRVSRIVGRDTDTLDEPDVIRATLESIAESSCDGVAAPLFYAALGALLAGPAGAATAALAYRSANTLDSTFGYKNERYLRFGWASARLDDLLNYLPARLNALCTAFTSCLISGGGFSGARSLRILLRDGHKHASPNSGLAEAAYAGALGIRLGGKNFYQGVASEAHLIGEPEVSLCREHIGEANLLLLTSTFLLALLLFVFMLLLRYGLQPTATSW